TSGPEYLGPLDTEKPSATAPDVAPRAESMNQVQAPVQPPVSEAKSKPTQKPSGPLGRALSMVHTEQADHPLSGGVFERPGLTIDQMQNQPGVSTINQKPVQGI